PASRHRCSRRAQSAQTPAVASAGISQNCEAHTTSRLQGAPISWGGLQIGGVSARMQNSPLEQSLSLAQLGTGAAGAEAQTPAVASAGISQNCEAHTMSRLQGAPISWGGLQIGGVSARMQNSPLEQSLSLAQLGTGAAGAEARSEEHT